MSDHPQRTLPQAASITHLKLEAKALRRAFHAGDVGGRERVAVHFAPMPSSLAQAQALFVVAREYGFPSWPALKRHVERSTRTVFAEAEGVGPALAELLGDANVTIADTLESAFDSDSEVLVLDLDHRRSDRLPPSTVAALRARKLVVTGPGAEWLCRELDLEIGGGMVSDAQPLRVIDSGLREADEPTEQVIEPLARPQAPGSYGLGQDPRHVEWRYIPDEVRHGPGGGFVEVLVGLEREEGSGVVTRQASCVFAGVMAHPDEWSAGYRELFGWVVAGLSKRDLEVFRPAIVPRQIHPPGVERFDLEPADRADADHRRRFFFQFDRPTVLTATLRHNGSDEAMLLFQGGRQQLYFTREDAEHGETLTIAVAVGQSGIDKMTGRYWTLDVTNFDSVNGMSAELTVRYDSLEGGDIRPLPSDASFEHLHWYAQQLKAGDANARQRATAEAFGFDDWRTLQAHVAWSEPMAPEDGARGRDIFLARARAKYGETFGLVELLDFYAAQAEVDQGLHRAVGEAFVIATAGQHASVGVEHLLAGLLDDPVARDVLDKCGADTALLRRDLRTALESVSGGEAVRVSRELVGVLCRADLYSVLGREGCNAANVLVGVFAERSRARELLERQGLSRRDVIRYVAHGIPKSVPAPHSAGVLAAPVEAVLSAAFAMAEAKHHDAFGVEHLLLALMDEPMGADFVASPAARRGMHDELAKFVDATSASADEQTRPTRALNRVMQKAVARHRSAGDGPADAASVLRAIASESRTFAADVLGRYNVSVA